MDERTGFKSSMFFSTKDGMVEPTCVEFDKWKQEGKPVRILRMDNAEENKLLEQRSGSADWKLGLKYEFTARDTPQQNHLAELGFSVIANRGRAMFSKANVPRELRYGLVRLPTSP